MKTIKNFITTLFLLNTFFSSLALSEGREAGNGGNAVVCRDQASNIISAELLDFYEGKTIRSQNFEKISKFSEIEIIMANRLQHLKKHSPNRFEKFKNDIKNFKSKSQFLYGQTLVPVSDSFHISYPKGCQVEQLAIQKKPLFPGDKTFFINGDIWIKLSALDQAGLIFHELLLTESLNYGHKNTLFVRYLTAALFDDSFETITFREFIELLNKSHFNQTDLAGYFFNFESCSDELKPGPKNEKDRALIKRIIDCQDQNIKSYANNKLFFNTEGDLVRIDIIPLNVSFDSTTNGKLKCNGRYADRPASYINLINHEIKDTNCKIQ